MIFQMVFEKHDFTGTVKAFKRNVSVIGRAEGFSQCSIFIGRERTEVKIIKDKIEEGLAQAERLLLERERANGFVWCNVEIDTGDLDVALREQRGIQRGKRKNRPLPDISTEELFPNHEES